MILVRFALLVFVVVTLAGVGATLIVVVIGALIKAFGG
jgi:hypothetical protein